MTAWQVIDCEELPDIKNRQPFRYYRLPNGEIWVPNNMGDYGEPSHFMKSEDFWKKLEEELEEELE